MMYLFGCLQTILLLSYNSLNSFGYPAFSTFLEEDYTTTTMTYVSSLYNTLPSLSEAMERFESRKEILDSISNLVSKYENLFDVCLIHTHCSLAEGEIMLEKGDVSQPVLLSEVVDWYPVSWLPSGEPYEFTTEPTITPDPSLLADFRALTQDIGVLGLRYACSNNVETRLEWSEGRMNWSRTLTEEDRDIETVETQWSLRKEHGKMKRTMACRLVCPTTTTKSGSHHTGTSIH